MINGHCVFIYLQECSQRDLLHFWKTDPLPESCPPFPLGSPTLNFLLSSPRLLLSNKARRQGPDYLHWPQSVSLGRLHRHSRTESHWHGERGEERGRKTGPGSSQSALLGRLMNVQDFTIFATQASGVELQWVTVSGSEKPSCPSQPLPPPFTASPKVPQETRGGRPPCLHKHWRSILDCSTPPSCHLLPHPLNSWLSRFHPVTHTCRSKPQAGTGFPACLSIMLLTAYSRLLASSIPHGHATWQQFIKRVT